MPRRIAVLLLVTPLVAAIAFAATIATHAPEPALACTGGIPPFETFAAETDLIVLVQADRVGDAINRAPTVTPSATPSAPATLLPSVTPPPTVPASFEPDPSVIDFDLRGIGVTFGVRRVIMGTTAPTIEYQWDLRSLLESQIRAAEAGAPPAASSCSFGSFIVRYEQGRQYLLFFNEYEGSMTVWASFPVDDGQVVLDDPRHQQANNGAIYTQDPETLARYFPGVRAENGLIKQPRVPLNVVLRAVAALRGDPSIAPPETGTAGLKGAR
jgi:hypothetical protein